MKSLVYLGPKNLEICEIEKPIPTEEQVLIRIKAVGICGSDLHGYLGTTGRRIPPMVMGHEFSGVVEDIGRNVKSVCIGERVTVQPAIFCGECEYCLKGYTNICPNKKFLGVMNVNGAMADYVCAPEKLIYKLPDSMTFEQGALIEPIAVAYSAVKKVAHEVKNSNVLIVGAGTIGLFILKWVEYYSPSKVVVADLIDTKLELAKKMGASMVWNTKEKQSFGTFDISFEAVGMSKTVQLAIENLKPKGKCVLVGNSDKMVELNMQDIVTNEKNIYGTYIYTHDEFGETIEIIKNNPMDFTNVISKIITIDEAPDYFEKQLDNKNGLVKVIIKM